jgi:hypothetical protein
MKVPVYVKKIEQLENGTLVHLNSHSKNLHYDNNTTVFLTPHDYTIKINDRYILAPESR